MGATMDAAYLRDARRRHNAVMPHRPKETPVTTTPERIPQPTPPYAAGVTVRRSTRISRGGYTGQRDQWETGTVEVVVDEGQPEVIRIGDHSYRTAELVDVLTRLGVIPTKRPPAIRDTPRAVRDHPQA